MAVIEVTSANYQKEIVEAKKVVLLDFWAVWCGPCQMLSPVVDEIGANNEDIIVGKINVDEQQELAEQFQVMSIPTLVVMKDGKETNRSVGVIPKSDIMKLL